MIWIILKTIQSWIITFQILDFYRLKSSQIEKSKYVFIIIYKFVTIDRLITIINITDISQVMLRVTENQLNNICVVANSFADRAEAAAAAGLLFLLSLAPPTKLLSKKIYFKIWIYFHLDHHHLYQFVWR